MKRIVLAFACGVLLTGAGPTALGNTSTHPPKRPCPEDATWVGRGNYANGYWSWYKCIAYDDVTVWAKRHY